MGQNYRTVAAAAALLFLFSKPTILAFITNTLPQRHRHLHKTCPIFHSYRQQLPFYRCPSSPSPSSRQSHTRHDVATAARQQTRHRTRSWRQYATPPSNNNDDDTVPGTFPDNPSRNHEDEFDFSGFLAKQKAQQAAAQSSSSLGATSAIRDRVKKWWNARRGSTVDLTDGGRRASSPMVQEINLPSSSTSRSSEAMSEKERLRKERHERTMQELSFQMAAASGGDGAT
eukprot:CAMPEP_0172514304 /NCGR_PEP_ID=MMETSP1066-20121228/259029_1 /TAXON_ID=671091 /ORGANISM="Coscinodiscus wailesii, Strain CCMP2513" /LENGTH=228 /DNA_ID=CAMNT_0013294917 /DNA_START=174 /DNA_END=857 /DNA_ORIENTATION=+